MTKLRFPWPLAPRWRGIGSIVLVAWLTSFATLPAQEFRAGTARAKITPETLGWMGGYAHRNRPAEGVEVDLWARALALVDQEGHRRILVSADIHIVTRRLHREIAEAARVRFGLEERELMLVATHTHSGPSLPEAFDPLICWDLNDADMQTLRATADRTRDQILEAIAGALGDLRPARLAFGRGEAHFGVNRRVPRNGDITFGANLTGVNDPDVPVLRVALPDGTPRAVVFTYACHGTSIRNGREGFYRYHPDFAGVAAEEIERRLPGTTALFLTGCAGEIDPQPLGGVKQAEAHGKALAEVVLTAIGKDAHPRALAGPIEAKYQEIRLPLLPAPPRAKYAALAESGVSYRRRHARLMLAQIDAKTVPTEIPLPIQVWRFGGDLTLVALGGEVGVDYALRLKKELGAEKTWVVAYANEIPCYIPSERVLKEGGYEAGWDRDQGPGVPGATGSILFYGWPAPLAAGVEDRVIAAVHALIKK